MWIVEEEKLSEIIIEWPNVSSTIFDASLENYFNPIICVLKVGGNLQLKFSRVARKVSNPLKSG